MWCIRHGVPAPDGAGPGTDWYLAVRLNYEVGRTGKFP